MPMSLTRDLKRSKEGMEGYEIGQEREREKKPDLNSFEMWSGDLKWPAYT